MSGKERIKNAMSHVSTEQIPWVPFAGVHAGFLKGYTAEEVLKDGDMLFESLMEVNRLYDPDGQPVCFDLQLEAEVLGCDLKWGKEVPPSVISHPFADLDTFPEPRISKEEGRIPLVLDVTRRFKEAVGDKTAVYGLYCGPFTLASHLRGSGLFMDMVTQPDRVLALMEYCGEIAKQMAGFYIEAECDVIAPVDPLISQISPRHFTQYCDSIYREIFQDIRQAGKHSSFFVCGNAIKNIEVMCQTGPDAISVDENLDMVQAKEITDRYNITLGGNIPLTTVMLFGNQQDNMKFVVDLLESIDTSKNFILSPGCDMPYNVPVANGIACAQAARDPKGAARLVADYTQAPPEDLEGIELADYESLERPLVELFSLDPRSCAACTYMLSVFEQAKERLGEEEADWADYRYYIKEDIARMAKLGIKNLPSIYINGHLKYDSIIPGVDELMETIRDSRDSCSSDG